MKINTKEYHPKTVNEGGITFFLPEEVLNPQTEKKVGKSMSVFYNPRMAINRDLTICVVKSYTQHRSSSLSYCDSMAATGIRSLRLLKNCTGISKVYINDLNPIAVEIIRKNLDYNKISPEKYTLSSQDAKLLLSEFYTKTNSYLDVIDIDPFGSPSQYLPAAMQSISVSEVGGLLCVTATDTPVLFGIKKEACVRKYLTNPIRCDFIKEMGTRILLYFIAKIANLFELYIEPVLSISANHFVRVFLHIRKGILGVNSNIKQFGFYWFCKSCFHRSFEYFDFDKSNVGSNSCPICQNTMIQSGLAWMGKLHNTDYVMELDKQLHDSTVQSFPSYRQLEKFVELAQNEDIFPPYFYTIPKIADLINSTYPSLMKIQERLKERGFNSSRTHFDPQALKTSASIDVVKEILQEFQS